MEVKEMVEYHYCSQCKKKAELTFAGIDTKGEIWLCKKCRPPQAKG
jgi:ribosomal protein L37AE/L43A